MGHVAMLVVAAVVAILQVAAVAPLAAHPLTVPLLPVALIAAWSAARDPGECWPVLVLTPLAAAPLSEERAGWYLLALLPAAAIAVALRSLERPARPPSFSRRTGAAALAAATGTLAHAAVLAVAAGVPGELGSAFPGLVVAATWTALLAAAGAMALWPARPRPRGLFA